MNLVRTVTCFAALLEWMLMGVASSRSSGGNGGVGEWNVAVVNDIASHFEVRAPVHLVFQIVLCFAWPATFRASLGSSTTAPQIHYTTSLA